jgi:Ca2+-binding RTX toxin-like protein
MAGGSGNDTYIVNATGDLISEARRGGVDHVRTSVDLTLAANVENLTMTGKADLTAVGNGSANLMTGNSGRNTLNGARGNDTLDGGGGNDRLTGGQGNDLLKGSTGADTLDGGSGRDVLTGGGGADVFVFAAGSGRDVITDFRKSADMIQLRDLGVSSFSEVRALATRVDGDVVIRFGEGDTLILRDTTIQALSEAMIFV